MSEREDVRQWVMEKLGIRIDFVSHRGTVEVTIARDVCSQRRIENLQHDPESPLPLPVCLIVHKL